MTLEWIRRNDRTFDRTLRAILFTDGEITELDEPASPGAGAPVGGSLAIGSLKQAR